jgi:hypothetical protein|tara:strand:+ start:138 stop:410 length:273 start_codon:yes stop_codon:yes gene_type:complete
MAVETYKLNDTVVVDVFGVNRVGFVVEKSKTVKGFRYLIHTEDGKEHENVYVDNGTVTTYINSRLTKSFVKSQTQSNNLINDAIDIVNNK